MKIIFKKKQFRSKGIGIFSVSATKQVSFSPGNLQYNCSTNTWSFASAQYEMVGIDNLTDGSVSLEQRYGYSKNGTTLDDKVDLFGWGTGNAPTVLSILSREYNTFSDWGTNQIGDDAPNTWRTLTYHEWDYLLRRRNNARELLGIAQVNGVNGLILLPDDWKCPIGITFKSGFYNGDFGVDYYVSHQIFNREEWCELETSGAVFLPAAGVVFPPAEGYSNIVTITHVQNYGFYWSATDEINRGAYYLLFCSDQFALAGVTMLRGYKRSVRLVKDL